MSEKPYSRGGWADSELPSEAFAGNTDTLRVLQHHCRFTVLEAAGGKEGKGANIELHLGSILSPFFRRVSCTGSNVDTATDPRLDSA